MQVNVYCTPRFAKTTVICLTLFSLIAKGLRHFLEYIADVHVTVDVYIVLFNIVVPVVVLAINVTVVCKVHRVSSSSTAASLGRQQSQHQHQHPHPHYNSAVPTVMLLTTSIIYALLCTTCSILYVITRWLPNLNGANLRQLVFAWRDLIYAYNFFVYLITGRQFRSELRKLFRFGHLSFDATVTNDVRLSLRSQTVTAV